MFWSSVRNLKLADITCLLGHENLSNSRIEILNGEGIVVFLHFM